MSLRRSLRLFLVAHRRGFLITLGVLVGLWALLNASFTAISGNDAVCLACHYMAPSHRSWEKSSHAEIPCVRCHDLGFGYFTSSLFKYSTGLYNPRARASVPNEACLQGDCHELEVVHRATGFGQSVAFDHRTHLQQLRRGERLWCTSCHSADEAGGTHFTTHEGTCYICHFKGAEQGRSVTECSVCHTAPAEEVEHAGFRFNHRAYVKLGVKCDECHVRITRGDTVVKPIRCHDCHVERLGRFDEFEFMHEKHVSERGISCFRCHDQFEHGSVEFISVLEGRCENCHSELHSPQKQMYMGVGGRGTADVPSRMFAAKVSCEGCHNTSSGPPGSDGSHAAGLEAKRRACIRCHGEIYGPMLDDWKVELDRALEYIELYERSAASLLKTVDTSKPRQRESAEFLRDALENIGLVRRGIGAHNVEYAVKLLNTSIDQIAFAYHQMNRRLPIPSRPAVLAQPDGYCATLCHDRLGTHGIEYFSEMEIDFDHYTHDFVSCTTCHSATKHKQKVISKGECMSCHHSEEGQAYGVGCRDCHNTETSLYEGSVTIAGLEIEPDVMALSDVTCSECHRVKAEGETLKQILGRCNSCHEGWGVEPLPVDQGFLETEVRLRRQSDALIVRLERQRIKMERLGRLERASEQMKRLLNEAEGDLNIVLKGRPHHNFAAAELILEKVATTLRRLEELTSASP